MKSILTSLFVAVSLPAFLLAADDAASGQAEALGQANRKSGPANAHPDAQWFPKAGLGLFIHWGIASIQAKGDLSWCMLANKPWNDATILPTEYYASIKDWHPDQVDYDKMLAAAKAAGFTYAVMVTKHHDGFTLWPSAYGDLGTQSSFGGRDFVKEFTDACRKNGLKVGLYYSPPDWYFDRLYRSWSHRGPALDMDHKPVSLPRKPADHDQKRKELVQGQVRELLTRYGKIDLVWFDGGRGELPNEEVRRLQPGIVINKRNGGGGDYGDSEGALPARRFNGWFESCMTCWPLRKWSYVEGFGYNDAPMTLTMLSILRAWGVNLLANVGPKGDGSIPAPALACWAEMARWMKHSRESLYDIQPGPGPWPEEVNQPVTLGNGVAYLHFLPDLPKALAVPPQERKFTRIQQVIPPLPAFTDTVIWKNAPRPAKVTLLRTGQELPFQYENGILTFSLGQSLRTPNVDVVKVQIAQ